MRISDRASKRLAVGVFVFALVIAVLAITMWILIETDATYDSPLAFEDTIVDIIMMLAFIAVGGIVAINRPGNLVGWSMLLSVTAALAGSLLGVYAELALLARPEDGLPLGLEAAVISNGSWTPLMAGVFLLVLLFPSGRVPTRRWRPLAKFVVAAFGVIWLGIATAPVAGRKLDPPFQDFDYNPLNFVHSELYMLPLYLLIALCLIAIILAAIGLVVRFLRSRGDERAQFKWLAFAALLMAASIPFSGTAGFGVLSQVADITFSLGLIALPVSVGVAVLRYRLYDIDRIINRTLVYALLTATLAAVYFGLVVGLQEVLRPLSGGSNLAIAVTTLVVAALFLPARHRVQDVVDRRFNRRAYDAARTIDAFSARLRQQIDLDTLRYELLAVVDETMQPVGASLWLRQEGSR